MPKTFNRLTAVAVTGVMISGLSLMVSPTASSAVVDAQADTTDLSIHDPNAQYVIDTYFGTVDKTWVKGQGALSGIVLQPYSGGPTATQQVLQRQDVLERRDIWRADDIEFTSANTEVEPLELSQDQLRIEMAASVYTEWDTKEADGSADQSSWEEYRKIVLTRASTTTVWKIATDKLLPDDYFFDANSQFDVQTDAAYPDPLVPGDTDISDSESDLDDIPIDSPSSDDPDARISPMPPLTPYAEPLDPYKAIKQNKLDRDKVAAKARQWSKKTGKMSNNFPKFKNNCANLASQSLRAGGWQYRNSYNWKSNRVWTPRSKFFSKPSYTWGGAANLYAFVNNTGKKRVSNIWNTRKGDLLFTDWDPNRRPDGKIDHVMIVTGSSGGKMRISQQSPARNHYPLGDSIRNAKKQGRTVKWYAKSMS